jgi:molecular chaperone IbpA
MNALVTTSGFPKAATDLFNQIFNGQDLFPISRQEGYPPYNAWVDADGTHKIEIALAGFSKDEITVNFDGRTLIITGEKKETTKDTDRRWLYRGLAKRKFVRQFDWVRGSFTIESAILKNGVLTISLKDETRKAVIEVQED